MNKWTYESDQTCYCDGTGTYERGFYAVSRAGYECGTEPERGPFRTQKQAAKAAAKIDADNAAQDARTEQPQRKMSKEAAEVGIRNTLKANAYYWTAEGWRAADTRDLAHEELE